MSLLLFFNVKSKQHRRNLFFNVKSKQHRRNLFFNVKSKQRDGYITRILAFFLGEWE